MNIVINGELKVVDENKILNLQDLVESLKLTNKRFALERNGEIVAKSQLPNEKLNEGDKFEIVGAVGGG
ncbi:MAG: sulfur carrier protein ThiS [Nitrosomonadales bacterium]|jgi:sulfur carrier protein